MVELAQIEVVVGGRHPRRIRVPEQQIERERLLAQQVVVDDVGPDQVFRPQHVEDRRHARAVEEALLRHHLLQRLELGLVDEHQQVAGLAEIDLGGEEGGRIRALVASGGHIGERGGEQRAADAIAERIDLWLPVSRLDGVDGGEHALLHVVLEGLLPEPLVGVDPGHHEHGEALIDHPLDERLLRA